MLPSPRLKPLQYFQYKECIYVAMHLRSSYILQKSKNYKTSFLSTSVEWCRAVYVSSDEGWLRLLSDSIIPHSPNSALNWEGRRRQTRERETFGTHLKVSVKATWGLCSQLPAKKHFSTLATQWNENIRHELSDAIFLLLAIFIDAQAITIETWIMEKGTYYTIPV